MQRFGWRRPMPHHLVLLQPSSNELCPPHETVGAVALALSSARRVYHPSSGEWIAIIGDKLVRLQPRPVISDSTQFEIDRLRVEARLAIGADQPIDPLLHILAPDLTDVAHYPVRVLQSLQRRASDRGSTRGAAEGGYAWVGAKATSDRDPSSSTICATGCR